MQKIKSISIAVVILAVVTLIYSDVIHSAISFTPKPDQLSSPTVNPINEAGSGTVIFKFNGVPLVTQTALDTNVQMNITGTINRVKVGQSFTNPSNEWVEGVYVFPLPANSAVDHLLMQIGDRIIEGQIKDREKARKIYIQAKNEGKKASLVEQQRPNIFTTRVANIPPGETIKISIEYQQAVRIDNDTFSIRFPMVVGERYIAGTRITTPSDALGMAPNTHEVKDASKITPPIDDNVDRPITINVTLKAGFDTSSIDSTYHDVMISDIDVLTKQITLENHTQADRDFELTWQPHRSLQPDLALFTQKKGDDHYLMLMAIPPKEEVFKKNNTPREVIFIVDSSGSMAGSSMRQASDALTQAIDRLSPTDRFNVIDFDDKFTPLFDSAMLAIKSNKNHGINFVRQLVSSGGTEALDAIKYALESRDQYSDVYIRQIIFLTDGQVGNEQEIFRTISQNIENDRFFTIGIGSAPNSYLMTKLADYGRGTFTYIGDLNEVEHKMLELFDKLESPALTNIDIQFPAEVDYEQGLSVISDLYAGETITAVFKTNILPNTLTITGHTVDGAFTKTVELNSANKAKGIDVLWARRKIDRLMDLSGAGNRRIDREKVQQLITDIALEHHLVSKFTSLVAVDITPSRPGSEILATKAISQRAKAPNTATNSLIFMLSGLFLMILSYVYVIVKKYRRAA